MPRAGVADITIPIDPPQMRALGASYHTAAWSIAVLALSDPGLLLGTHPVLSSVVPLLADVLPLPHMLG